MRDGDAKPKIEGKGRRLARARNEAEETPLARLAKELEAEAEAAEQARLAAKVPLKS